MRIGARTARVAALAGMLALAGCKTVENSLSQNDVAAMKLAAVSVSFAPEAHVQWEDGIRAYATAKAIPDDEIATGTNTPEGKAYTETMLAPKIKAGLEQKVGPQGIVGTAVQAAIDASSAQSPAEKLVGTYGDMYCRWLLRSA